MNKGCVMNKLKLLPLSAIMVVLAGCSSFGTNHQDSDVYVSSADANPNSLTGMSVQERIRRSKARLGEQDVLLSSVKGGEQINNYRLITNNNNLDTREGSPNTVPLNLAQQDVPLSGKALSRAIGEVSQGVVQSEQVVDVAGQAYVEQKLVGDLFDKKIKVIDWKNDSLNKLSKQFADGLGYFLVVKKSSSGKNDMNVDYKVEQETFGSAINKLAEQTSKSVDILVVPENKTFNVLYK